MRKRESHANSSGPQLSNAKLRLRLQKGDSRPQATRDSAIRRAILSIPKGKVATYGEVAAAAGYPLHHRAVARLLRASHGDLPWQRVVGAGGAIKTRFEHAVEQRMRLQWEGVMFQGARVALESHRHAFALWDLQSGVS